MLNKNLFAITIFISSFLLFLVQPIIAKQILPWFGGTSAVWTTCLTFFQVALLLGYMYSDWIQRFSPKKQGIFHCIVICVSLIFLPIIANPDWKPINSEEPIIHILGLLFFTIGLPYFVLSTTGPLLQSWFARENKFSEESKKTYRLFALSNLASIIGLLMYPFAIETWITLSAQAITWSIFYFLFAVFAILTALRVVRSNALSQSSSTLIPEAIEEKLDRVVIGRQDKFLWIFLPFIATSLLLAISNHITQNIASIPFLWVFPLTLYLLTFVVVFEGRGGRGWYERPLVLIVVLIFTAMMAWGLIAENGVLSVKYAAPLYIFGLFFICLFCHGEVALRKPPTEHLTQFYLSISIGGALGGFFVSIISPLIFSFYWELPLILLISCITFLWMSLYLHTKWQKVIYLLLTVACLSVTAYFCQTYYFNFKNNSLLSDRNFYGTLRVSETKYLDQDTIVRRLVHGVIMHGTQDMSDLGRTKPTSYYIPSSGVGITLLKKAEEKKNLKVGIVGLGTGTLLTYGRSGDEYRIYEINPEVIQVAKNSFTYIKDSAASISYALGDARLVLERELPNQFDVLIIDAFSSDSIPIHLITQEAFNLYTKHIKADGVIVFHVSNRYLNLPPVLNQLVSNSPYHAILVRNEEPDPNPFDLSSSSEWIIISKNNDFLNSKEFLNSKQEIEPIPSLRLWSDNFSNLFQILK